MLRLVQSSNSSRTKNISSARSFITRSRFLSPNETSPVTSGKANKARIYANSSPNAYLNATKQFSRYLSSIRTNQVSSASSSSISSLESRGEARKPLDLKIGQVLHDFVVKEITPVPERNLTAIKLQHQTTGAEHLHIDCSDTNNVFCVTFKTIPRDSTGVAHILEHTTLCGSEKYPVRDPFFNMIKRSLNTYMNAWTGSDYTSYPFSTQNAHDFNNLLSVYLDATFYPRLQKLDFMQEGHRFEYHNIEDPKSPLEYKGVVFNEMKGALSDPGSLFYYRLTEHLYPSETYHYNSGGEPTEIPNLTYEQLKSFHARHYHPSNARFFTYGDLSLENHLNFINEHALKKFQRIDPQTDIKDEIRLTSPKRIHMKGPETPMATDPERQTKVCVATLTNKITDVFETTALSILSTLLLNGPNSPMYKVLIESNIGSAYSPYTGYNPYAKEASFGIGLQGIKEDEVDKVEQLILQTLEQVAKEGFDPTRVESVLHQIEISQKNVTTSFGIQILSGIANSWIHGANPVEHLQLNEFIARLREELAKGPFFENLIRKHLLDNPHRITFVMTPDPDYNEVLAKEEREKLEKIQQSLTPEQSMKIIEESKQLVQQQERKTDVSCLPTLRVDVDVPRTEEPAPIILTSEFPLNSNSAREPLNFYTAKKQPKVVESAHNANNANTISTTAVVKPNVTSVQWCPQPTNGILFFRAMTSIPDLPEDLIPYVPLFCNILTQMGTKNLSHRELAAKMELYTGGISASSSLIVNHSNLDKIEGNLLIMGSALERNIQPMFDLIREILTQPTFTDKELLRTFINQRTADFQDSLMSDGHVFARTYASSSFNRATNLTELWNGVSQVEFMQQRSQDEELTESIEKLQRIAQLVLQKPFTKCLVTGEEHSFDKTEKPLKDLLSSLPFQQGDSSNIGNKAIEPSYSKSFFALPGSVNYAAKCIKTVPYTHPDSVKLLLLSRVLSQCYLHRELREKGGAYGGGASLSSGIFSFYSYRDPRSLKTLEDFSKSPKWLSTPEFKEQDIEEGKLSIFGDIDSPVPPSAKGSAEFTTGITWEMRQQRRERLFAVTKKDLIEVADKYITQRENESSIAIFGAEDTASQLESMDKGWEIRSL